MELPTIVKELEYFEGTFPHHALEAAVAAKDQVTPLLLPILAPSPNTIHARSEQKAYMAHIYALFLLAQFREKRAYPLIVNFFATPGEMALDVTGDVVTEYLDRILASVCGGESINRSGEGKTPELEKPQDNGCQIAAISAAPPGC